MFVYHRSGEETRLPVPTEFTEDLPECTLQSQAFKAGIVLPDRPCPTWNQRLYPSLDGRGNIVLMGYHRAIAGASRRPGNRLLRRAAEVDARSHPQGRPDLRGQRPGVHPGRREDDRGGCKRGR